MSLEKWSDIKGKGKSRSSRESDKWQVLFAKLVIAEQFAI
jgi:hypothetical protein